MIRLNSFATAAALTIAAFAAPASAATWSLEKQVVGVEVEDAANNGGTGKQLAIFLSSAGTYCGSSTTTVIIKQTESTLWDHWVRQAEAAFLSGRNLKIFSSNNTGTCKAWSLVLQ